MYVRVKAAPGARRESVVKKGELEYEISVREKAERNLANNRLRAVLAVEFGVSEKAVRLVNGHRSPSKLFRIETPGARKK
ncbi:MAG: DUF167 domain-containing protein [Patescibacteria group bacterium]